MQQAENKGEVQRLHQMEAVITEHYELFGEAHLMEAHLMNIFRAALASEEMDGWSPSDRVGAYDYLRGLINFNAKLGLMFEEE